MTNRKVPGAFYTPGTSLKLSYEKNRTNIENYNFFLRHTRQTGDL